MRFLNCIFLFGRKINEQLVWSINVVGWISGDFSTSQCWLSLHFQIQYDTGRLYNRDDPNCPYFLCNSWHEFFFLLHKTTHLYVPHWLNWWFHRPKFTSIRFIRSLSLSLSLCAVYSSFIRFCFKFSVYSVLKLILLIIFFVVFWCNLFYVIFYSVQFLHHCQS